MNEDHPIYRAIDSGGGQTCDIQGVIRSLGAAGYVIVPKIDLGVVLGVAQDHKDEGPRGQGWQSDKLENACHALSAALKAD